METNQCDRKTKGQSVRNEFPRTGNSMCSHVRSVAASAHPGIGSLALPDTRFCLAGIFSRASCAWLSCITPDFLKGRKRPGGTFSDQPLVLQTCLVWVIAGMRGAPMSCFTIGFIAGAIFGPGTLLMGILLAISLVEHAISRFKRWRGHPAREACQIAEPNGNPLVFGPHPCSLVRASLIVRVLPVPSGTSRGKVAARNTKVPGQ